MNDCLVANKNISHDVIISLLLSYHRYGVPPIPEVPKGFSPLAEVWGKGKNRDPLLVSFVYPTDWIVTLPSQDVNGEDGTIQAGEYGKGDTSTFFVYSDEGKIDVSLTFSEEQNMILPTIEYDFLINFFHHLYYVTSLIIIIEHCQSAQGFVPESNYQINFTKGK